MITFTKMSRNTAIAAYLNSLLRKEEPGFEHPVFNEAKSNWPFSFVTTYREIGIVRELPSIAFFEIAQAKQLVFEEIRELLHE